MSTNSYIKMKQFRYYQENNPNNSFMEDGKTPCTWSYFCISENFKEFAPINVLGIQTLPGTKFYLNSSMIPITIGQSGIFELDVTGTSATINNIRFEQGSMQKIRDNDSGFLIIDIAYEEQMGG